MMKRLLRNCAIRILALSEQEEEQRPVRTASKQAFERRGGVLMAARRDTAESITAGTIQLLGLDDIKRDLGASWPKISSRAMSLAEAVIKSHLTQGDIYTQQGNDAFVLFFAHKTPAEGAETAQSMSAEIKAAIAKELPKIAGAIGVDHFVAEVANDVIFEDNREQPLADVLFNSLAKIRAEAEQALNKKRAALIRDARVVFRPVWNPSKRAVLIFRCMLDSASGATALEHLALISEPDQLQSAMAELDLLVFGRAIKSLHELLHRESRSVLLIPIHFCTFLNKSAGDEYIRVCQGLPEPYRKFIFFELHGVPAGTPGSRIEQICSFLQPFCHSVILEAGAPSRDFSHLTTANMNGISLDFTDASGDMAASLKSAVAIARSKNLIAIVHGANSISQLQAAISAGFDYVNGEAVHISMDEPKGAFKFMPMSLMEDSLPRVSNA
jgi:hypothetical protein